MEHTSRAFVLSTHHHTDTDMRVVFYSQTHGKLQLLARGMRKPSSKLAHTITIPSVLHVRWVEGRRYHILAGSEVEKSFPNTRSSFTTAYAVRGLMTILSSFTQELEPDDVLFTYTVEFFEHVDTKQGIDMAFAGAVFIVHMLTILGLLADFGRYDTIQSRHISKYSQHIIGTIQHMSLEEALAVNPQNAGDVLHGAIYFVARQHNIPPRNIVRQILY